MGHEKKLDSAATVQRAEGIFHFFPNVYALE